jgi:hypothetical protein
MRDETAAGKAYSSCVGLYSFCACIVTYHYIMNDFIPIQNKVIEFNKQLAIANANKERAEKQLAEK